MRISDWSSDVCSSDLPQDASSRSKSADSFGGSGRRKDPPAIALRQSADPCRQANSRRPSPIRRRFAENAATRPCHPARRRTGFCPSLPDQRGDLWLSAFWRPFPPSPFDGRSEEHTSELQSLMRISYAVFCLKKKKQK